jgi:formylmethanofuran dehydrogenase subunit E
MPTDLSILLKRSASEHSHLCPRQVLGVRMGLAGLEALGVKSPVTTKTTLVYIETDGCFADGIRVATGATVGHRTLKVQDLGKIAATFTDLKTPKSVRLALRMDIREKALAYSPEESRRYYAQLKGYLVMPEIELFSYQWVELIVPPEKVIGRSNARTHCTVCGEEIINSREVKVDGKVLCQTCAYGGYYRVE